MGTVDCPPSFLLFFGKSTGRTITMLSVIGHGFVGKMSWPLLKRWGSQCGGV